MFVGWVFALYRHVERAVREARAFRILRCDRPRGRTGITATSSNASAGTGGVKEGSGGSQGGTGGASVSTGGVAGGPLSGTGGSDGTGGTQSASECGVDPVNPNATEQAKNLLCYLYDIYGSTATACCRGNKKRAGLRGRASERSSKPQLRTAPGALPRRGYAVRSSPLPSTH